MLPRPGQNRRYHRRMTHLVLQAGHGSDPLPELLQPRPDLRHVELTLHDGLLRKHWPALAAAPWWPQLETVGLRIGGLTPEWFEDVLAVLPTSLRRLDLSTNSRLGDAGLAQLVAWPGFRQLEVLVLDDCGLTDLAPLATAQGRLQHLSLADNPLSACAPLAVSPAAAGLTSLWLGSGLGTHTQFMSGMAWQMSGMDDRSYGTPIGDEGAAELAEAPFLPGLHTLRLGSSALSGAGLARLTPHLHTRVLDLRSNDFEDDDLASLPAVRELEVLDLGSCGIEGPALRTLGAADWPALHTLALHHAIFSDGWLDGWSRSALPLRTLGLGMASMGGKLRELLRTPPCAGLTSLHTLDVDGSGLVDAPCLPTLTTLRVPWAELESEQIEALLPHLPELAHVDLTGNALGDDGLAALLASGRLRQVRTLVLERCRLTEASVEALLTADVPDDARIQLGDNELGEAACKALRARFPDARADWLVAPRTRRERPRILDRS